MKKIAFVIYREWAFDICKAIVAFQKEKPGFSVEAIITTPECEFIIKDPQNFPKVYVVEGKDNGAIDSILKDSGIEAVCYYGWSWIVKEPILSNYICLCLHPSPLPRYRGGSPIQNQIIDGQMMSAVTVFKMTEGLDDGDIYKQIRISFEGTLSDIFGRMVDAGILITKEFVEDFVNNRVIFTPQQGLEENPPMKRRTKEQSELSLEKISHLSYGELYNMVRALTDPYPNINIRFSDSKLSLQEVEEYKTIPEGGLLLTNGELKTMIQKGSLLYVRLSSGYACITKYRVEELETK